MDSGSTTTTIPSGLKPGEWAHWATLSGWPTPLTSTTTRSIRSANDRTESSVSAKSSAMEQQTQPLARMSTSSVADSSSRPSMSTSPKSLTSTAMRWPSGSASNRFSSVVLPAPR